MNGVERIAAERQRQIDVHGYTTEHDVEHKKGSLAFAAAVYAAPEPVHLVTIEHDLYDVEGGALRWHEPWPRGWRRYQPRVGVVQERIRELEKAGALIAAEIDRLLALEES